MVVLTEQISRLRTVLPPLLDVRNGQEDLLRPVVTPRVRQRRLTREQVDQLVTEYQAGDSMQVLALRWELHRTTVAGHLLRTGVPLRRQGIPNQELEEAVRLYGGGWSCQRLAERYDCDDETVRQALKRSGVKMRMPWERL